MLEPRPAALQQKDERHRDRHVRHDRKDVHGAREVDELGEQRVRAERDRLRDIDCFPGVNEEVSWEREREHGRRGAPMERRSSARTRLMSVPTRM